LKQGRCSNTSRGLLLLLLLLQLLLLLLLLLRRRRRLRLLRLLRLLLLVNAAEAANDQGRHGMEVTMKCATQEEGSVSVHMSMSLF